MKKNSYALLAGALSLLLPFLATAQPSCYQNPSMEGTSQPHVVPAPWQACYGSPDTQPGQWGFTQPASNGSTYVSFLHDGSNANGYNEGMTQLLSPCMVAGQTYSFTVDLAHSNVYQTADPLDCYSSMIVYGGNSACDPAEILWTSGSITNTNWTTYTVTFTPTQNWCYLSFSPYFITACSGYINLMMDNISCVSQVNTTVQGQNVTCNGACNGSAWATPVSGTPPYTYNWMPGGLTTDTINGLCPGTYTVTITDAMAAQVVDSVTITQPTPITLQAAGQDVSCNGANDGSGTVTASGGTGPYTYQWLPSGGTNATATNLAPGTYTVVVNGVGGCADTASITINQPAVLAATITGTNPTCNSQGSASVVATGGTPTYVYSWSPSGGNGSTANNLPGGSYTCTITDQNGCSTTQSVTLTQPPAITALSSHTNVLCNGGNTGSASVTASGGAGGYTYNWTPSGGTGSSASGLTAGNYTCTITDAAGCTFTQTFSITQPPQLTLSANGNSGCEGTGGTLVAAAGGGSPAYTYSWSNSLPNGSTQTVNPSQTTTYSVTVTDANGCTSNSTATYTVNPLPVAAFSTPATNGVLNLSFANGPQQICLTDLSTGSTVWGWTMNGSNPSIQQSPCYTVPDTGSYCFVQIVSTAQNCLDTAQICIEVIESAYSIPNVFTPNGDGNNDAFEITNRGMKSVHCQIFNRWGQLVYEWDGPTGKWDGKMNNGNIASDGTYYYVAKLTDMGDQVFNETGFLELIDGKH